MQQQGESRFEAKVKGRIGPVNEDSKSIRVLTRLVHWTDDGIEYAADQRHAKIIVREPNLKTESKEAVMSSMMSLLPW